MTPSEYTQFRETIQTDHPDLYQYLPDRFDLLRWQEFAVKLLDELKTTETLLTSAENDAREAAER